LWQRPEGALVDEMIGSGGMTAVIMKVAGLGLKVTDVGKTLQELRPRLAYLVGPLVPGYLLGDNTDERRPRQETMYHCHVAGEGGEFETTTIDCPLFYDRISL
jgi:diphthine-ammonia ligase